MPSLLLQVTRMLWVLDWSVSGSFKTEPKQLLRLCGLLFFTLVSCTLLILSAPIPLFRRPVLKLMASLLTLQRVSDLLGSICQWRPWNWLLHCPLQPHTIVLVLFSRRSLTLVSFCSAFALHVWKHASRMSYKWPWLQQTGDCYLEAVIPGPSRFL